MPDAYNSTMIDSSNLITMLAEALEPHRFALVQAAQAVANQQDLPLYLVGGAVRDLLIGRPIIDLDLVVEGDAAYFASGLAAAISGEVTHRSQFGTYKVKADDDSLDLVTARTETYRRPGALPTVRPGDIAQDLARRDFTINAIALRLAPAQPALLDPWDGRQDIERGVIRVLHSVSFQDDATRILRAIRYEQRLGFDLDSATEDHLLRDLSMLTTISGDRLRREMGIVFREEKAAAILMRLSRLDVLSNLHPFLPDPLTLDERLQRLALMNDPVHPLHFLGLLVYSMASPYVEEFVRRLNMPVTWARMVRDVARSEDAVRGIDANTSAGRVYDLLRPLNIRALHVVGAITREKTARENVQTYVSTWRHTRTLLNGHDLALLGVPQGPQAGELLKALLNARLEGHVRTTDDERQFVRRRIMG
jgi:tRNA nucleotidyltransferase (CCA-adding enzyme)